VAEDHDITIAGQRWLLRFTRLKGRADGWTCYDEKPPKLLVDERLTGSQRLETVLHEIAHAVLGPSISEESITELARVQRRVLWQILRYREVPRGE
jgi:Zn-dependent peptidase ImmA (M78 family)